MELHEFITATLLDIQRGVQKAIETAGKEGLHGAINPSWRDITNAAIHDSQSVQFDIAVTVADKNNVGAETGISVVGIKLGVDGSSVKEQSHVSRIQFAVPIVPPTTQILRPTSDV